MLVLTALGAISIAYPELLGNGKDTVQLAVTGKLAVGLLAALVVLKPIVTAGCLGSGAPGGLFTPTLTYGVLLGGPLGHAWTLLWPGAAAGSGAQRATSVAGPFRTIEDVTRTRSLAGLDRGSRGCTEKRGEDDLWQRTMMCDPRPAAALPSLTSPIRQHRRPRAPSRLLVKECRDDSTYTHFPAQA